MKRLVEDVINSYERCHLYSKCSSKCAYYPIKKYLKPNMYDALPCHTRMIDDISFLLNKGEIRFKDGKSYTRDEYDLEFCPLERVINDEIKETMDSDSTDIQSS